MFTGKQISSMYVRDADLTGKLTVTPLTAIFMKSDLL